MGRPRIHEEIINYENLPSASENWNGYYKGYMKQYRNIEHVKEQRQSYYFKNKEKLNARRAELKRLAKEEKKSSS